MRGSWPKGAPTARYVAKINAKTKTMHSQVPHTTRMYSLVTDYSTEVLISNVMCKFTLHEMEGQVERLSLVNIQHRSEMFFGLTII